MSDPVAQLARAILYEGYLLYPYRLSSLKNRQRWNFGVLYPPAFCGENESSIMQTECLLAGTLRTTVSATIRFLQSCSEATVERQVDISDHTVKTLLTRKVQTPFSFSNIVGALETSAAQVNECTFRLTVRIVNQTWFEGTDREAALQHSLLSTQSLLQVRDGAFHSMIDPPHNLLSAKEHCRNIGAWPVLIGAPGQRDRMLSAPIILYDYPTVAPQSPADLFDNTEIDEILTLRIQTLTPEEKVELRNSDPRAKRLLDQTESATPQQLQSLHGTFHAASTAGATMFRPGDRVRLKPSRRADIFDIALSGRTATVTSIEEDFESNAYVCVTVDDDPGKDLGVEGKPGHRFFFSLDEVEKIT